MLKKMKRALALTALLSSTAGVAHATEGWYGRIDLGHSIDGNIDGTITDTSPSTVPFDPDLDDDWMYGAGLGYAFSNGFRLEGELSHRSNEYGPFNESSFIDDDLSGEVQATSLMANLFYDFNRGGRFEPYIGIGAGASKIDIDVNGTGVPWFTGNSADDTVLAYQGIVGVAIGLTERLDLDLAYRYFVAPDVDISDAFSDVPATSDIDYEHQAITLGLRWQFGGAAAAPVVAPPPAPPPVQPPPPPPPAACPVSEFVVYFEWDRSALNQAALETIDAAVARARQCNVSAVTVVGHTDTSGATAYNQGLSERRASVVRDALVARGIAGGAITSSARGETELARATRDGVREPLNRRTAVTIRFR